MRLPKRRKGDLSDLSACGLDGFELAPQRMVGAHLVIAIGTDQHEVLQIGPGQQVLEHIQGGRVEPLQVVEKERQWMVCPGKDTDEALEYQLEAALCVLWRKHGDRGRLAD